MNFKAPASILRDFGCYCKGFRRLKKSEVKTNYASCIKHILLTEPDSVIKFPEMTFYQHKTYCL